MATVVGIFEKCFLQKKPMTVVRPGSQSRRFTHIDDTVNICYIAMWRKKKNQGTIVFLTKKAIQFWK